MKASELRKLSDEELKKESTELLRTLFKLRIQRASEQLKRHSQFKNSRRDIARIKTIMKERAKEHG
ncbi:MAG: 50S ribosomal protein L29 [Beggiatoa sp. IS2]|jgi:large subunit ribosomal protein L29|nr:MAG: 50S ribosomal protein L29 [Beggiatoa sp. IS2]